ncbi:Dicer-like protein 1 [Dissophora globulifera]|nr:Dicer-like protein 1 [Dissophora globulifera]
MMTVTTTANTSASTTTTKAARPSPDAPRTYQLEVAKRAMEGNIIAVSDTGSGKTLISVLLLKHVVAKSRQEAAETGRRVPLVFQQQAYIANNSDIKTEAICGAMNVDTFDHEMWNAIFDRVEAIVLTGQILENCSILIFDECHHAIGNHNYRQIMNTFYRVADPQNRPKIFGMTASPPKDKGAQVFSAMELERTLNARIITASYDQVLHYIRKPIETVIRYDATPDPIAESLLSAAQGDALQQLRLLCIQDNKFKSALGAFEYAMADLGPWCAIQIWKYALQGLRDEIKNGTGSQVQQRLEQVGIAEEIAKNVQAAPLDTSLALVRDKLKTVVNILQSQRDTADGFCAILFVERRPVAHVLYEFLMKCKRFGPDFGLDFIQPAVLTGHGSKGDVAGLHMQLKTQRRILDGFRKGRVNLLVATDVAEEGLDIDRCRMVIRFDIKNALISHIQSRGRARDPSSEYILMQPHDAASHLEKIRAKENEMREWCSNLSEDRVIKVLGTSESDSGSDDDKMGGLGQMRELANVETTYLVRSTGARMTFATAVSLLYQYCASLPSDVYTRSAPVFEISEAATSGEWECSLTLPPNAPLDQFYSGAFSKKKIAKNAAAFKACKALHLLGALNDRLLPHRNKAIIEDELQNEQSDSDSGDSDGEKAEDSVGEGNGHSKKSLRKYLVNHPKFWGNKIFAPTGANQVGVHMTRFTLRKRACFEAGGQNTECSSRSLCLLTAQPLPQFDPIELFFDVGSRWVHMDIVNQPLILVGQQLEDLHRYAGRLYHNIFRKTVDLGSPMIGMRHIIAPLKPNADNLFQEGITPDQLIDWDEIKAGTSTTNTGELIRGDSSWEQLQDRVFFEMGQFGRLYYASALRTDLNPASVILDDISREKGISGTRFCDLYRDQHGIYIQDMHQPLIEAKRVIRVSDLLQPNMNKSQSPKSSVPRFLIPELCSMLPISASVLRSAWWTVSVLERLDSLLLTEEFLAETNLSIKIPLMLEALTTSELAHAMNYQRLELLGDTVLKLLTSLDLYIRHPSLDEGQLTIRRTAMINNKRLYKRSRRLKLDRFIVRSRPVNTHFFGPSIPYDAASAPPPPEQWLISEKTMADLIESTLGAAYLSGEFDLALKASETLLGPVEGVNSWDDFARLYHIQNTQRTANQVPFIPPSGFGDLGTIERVIGYKFSNLRHLAEALTHATSFRPQTQCYQRLEFMGDALLDMLVARYWVAVYPVMGPGKIHLLKSASINNQILGVICIQLGLHQHILHMSSALAADISRAVEELQDAIEDAKESSPTGEPEREFWEDFTFTKVLGDVLESVIGAVFVDSGFDFSIVQNVFDRCILPVLKQHISMETLKLHPINEPNSPSIRPSSPDSFWSRQEDDPVANPLQEYAVLFHGNVIASVVSSQARVARKDVAKKVLGMLDDDPSLVERHCGCPKNRLQRALPADSDSSVDSLILKKKTRADPTDNTVVAATSSL